jgi:hypothetical protein
MGQVVAGPPDWSMGWVRAPILKGDILYVGITDSFQRRIREHRDGVWASAWQYGATHVLARVISNKAERLAEEQDLIRYYQPALNTQRRFPPSPPMKWPGRPNSVL